MVEVDEVRDLVRRDVAADLRRREDQPPAHPDPALRRAAAPARRRVADRDRARHHAGRGGEFGDVARHGVARAALEEALDRARNAVGGPAATKLTVEQPRRARPVLAPDDADVASFERDDAPGTSGSGGSARASCASIQSRWSSAQASAARRLVRHGQVSLSVPAASSNRSRSRRAVLRRRISIGTGSARLERRPQSGRSTT